MTIQEAVLTLKPFRRKDERYETIQYFLDGTGPFKEMVECNYFVVSDGNEEYFTLSLDLYPDELLASDWELVPDSNKIVLYTK